MMDRRAFIVGSVAGLAAPLAAEAQQAGTVYRIGILSPEIPPPGLVETVRDELRQLGHIEGKTLTIEARHAEGRNERLPALADELLALKVVAILAVNTSAALAAKRATTTVPIVIARVADPVKSGLVASLSRPGGNVTGVSFMPDVIAVKGLELLKEALPRLSRAAALWYADNPGASIVVDEMQPAAIQLALTLQRLPIRRSSDLVDAFETAVRHRAEAIVVVDDALVTKHRVEIVSLAMKHSLPVLSEYKPFVEVGGLIAYGPSTAAMYRRAAQYVDKILRGTKPGDLPIEQPTKFDLFVNLRTAKALGITIPPSLLARADQVIE
jgi:putative tryptophan/tyrosine transport system substrate-binding protein